MYLDDFDDVSQELEKLDRRVDELTHEVRRHSEQADDVAQQEHLETVEHRLKRLADRVAVLERGALATTTERADLDTVTPTDRKLARSAQRARQLRSRLLPQGTRAAQRQQIRHLRARAEALGEAEQALVDAARGVAQLRTRDPRTDEHRAAQATYQRAVTRLRSARSAAPDTWRQQVQRLEGELAEDTKLQAKHGADITAGEADWRKLCTRLRARLDNAVDSGRALPVWFTTVLGPTPPAENTNTWAEVATQLIAYRVTYNVTDKVVALGPPPADDDTIRTEWYRKLTRKLSQFR